VIPSKGHVSPSPAVRVSGSDTHGLRYSSARGPHPLRAPRLFLALRPEELGGVARSGQRWRGGRKGEPRQNGVRGDRVEDGADDAEAAVALRTLLDVDGKRAL
jgi:hypothetical protein